MTVNNGSFSVFGRVGFRDGQQLPAKVTIRSGITICTQSPEKTEGVERAIQWLQASKHCSGVFEVFALQAAMQLSILGVAGLAVVGGCGAGGWLLNAA
jgi:hypothetical protein